jgi:hypothetical protein
MNSAVADATETFWTMHFRALKGPAKITLPLRGSNQGFQSLLSALGLIENPRTSAVNFSL